MAGIRAPRCEIRSAKCWTYAPMATLSVLAQGPFSGAKNTGKLESVPSESPHSIHVQQRRYNKGNLNADSAPDTYRIPRTDGRHSRDTHNPSPCVFAMVEPPCGFVHAGHVASCASRRTRNNVTWPNDVLPSPASLVSFRPPLPPTATHNDHFQPMLQAFVSATTSPAVQFTVQECGFRCGLGGEWPQP